MGAKRAEVKISYCQLHELDCAARSLNNAIHAVFKDVVAFGGIDLAIVSPSDSMFRLSESVTDAHGSAKTWPDGELTSVKSRQDLPRSLNRCQPRCVWFCCPEEIILHMVSVLVLQISIHSSARVINLENIAPNGTLPLSQQNWCRRNSVQL